MIKITLTIRKKKKKKKKRCNIYMEDMNVKKVFSVNFEMSKFQKLLKQYQKLSPSYMN